MKTITATFLLGLVAVSQALAQPYAVNFNTASALPIPAVVTDWLGAAVAGTNFWAQLYSADGWTATAGQLAPAGISINFRSGASKGTVQVSGNNGRGEAVNPTVVVSPNTAMVSVQMRAWEGPYLSYEDAVAAGAQHGTSRILRMQAAAPPAPPANLIDSEGPLNSFSLIGPPALSINNILVAEGTNGTVSATFAVTLLPPSEQTVTVAYGTVDGSALAVSDYESASGTLTFEPGETNKPVTVLVTGDAIAELDESFLVVLSSPINAVLTPRFEGTCTITEVHIRGISVDTSVTFNTIAGHSYLLEWATTAAPETWTTVEGAGNVVGTGALFTVLDKGSGCAPGRLYRARLIQ